MADLEAIVQALGGTWAGGLRGAGARPPVDVLAVRLDSRQVVPGDLFAALPGAREDGARFAAEAVRRGAVAVLSARPLELAPGVSNWVHPDARRVAGEAAALVLGDPSRRLFVVAITGTNGKTTTAHLCGQLLERAGRRPAVLGTAGHALAGGMRAEATLTTPDACELQALLARHLELGGDSVALEASSHALEQERLAGLSVSVAVFTNLTRDHLDYHGDMERYAAAKERLFASLPSGSTAVVNAGDPSSARMARAARARGARVVTYSTAEPADLRASRLRTLPDGTRFTIHGMGIHGTGVNLPLVGRFNVENALAAAAAVLAGGASPSIAMEGLASAAAAPGRLERVDARALGIAVLVDYAHTPDALEKVLSALRETLSVSARRGGRLVCVMGCGGDRDRGKRAPMGEVAGRLAERVVVTSDNPRSEDPGAIAAEILSGLRTTPAEAEVELDRRAAIARALSQARPGDVVLIAGKGHETTQAAAGASRPFDDRAVAAEEIARLAAGERGAG